MNKVIWKLTESEKNEIQELYDKKIALENLINSINASNEELYNKLTTDYKNNMTLYQKWWAEISEKYNWEKGAIWTINFTTNEVISDR